MVMYYSTIVIIFEYYLMQLRDILSRLVVVGVGNAEYCALSKSKS
jgi:hypothetical protein